MVRSSGGRSGDPLDRPSDRLPALRKSRGGGGAWSANGWTPFRLVEEVVRSWIFEARREDGTLVLAADASNDKADWERGTNLRLECGQCFGTFPLPPEA